MALTLAALLRSELGAWFGVHEVGRETIAGGHELRLKPGGHAQFIDIIVRVDAEEQIQSASLLLDRAWIDAPATAPFAADLLKSALPILAPNDERVRDLAQRIARFMHGENVLVHANAMPAPLPPPVPPIAAALAAYRGEQQRAQFASAAVLVRLENVAASGTNRLQITLAPPGDARAAKPADAVKEPKMVTGNTLDLLSTFLQAADLPAGMSMPQDDRARGPDPGDLYFGRFRGLQAGLARWHSPDGPAGRLIDIRWLFADERSASDYHRTTLSTNSEGLPEAADAPSAGDECRIFGGLYIDPALRAMIGDKTTPMARYLYVFRVGPVVAKLFIADTNEAGLMPELAGGIARNAAARIKAGLGSTGGTPDPVSRSWWRTLLRR